LGDTVNCIHCAALNSSDRRFCGKCGAPLAAVCLNCRFENNLEDGFCGGCGQAIGVDDDTALESAQAADPKAHLERRELTILFADLCGYTRLTSELESEDLHHIMRRFTEIVDNIIEAYGGVVARHLGDAVMGLFGFPMAHSNDSERALRACLAIHEAMESLSAELDRDLRVHIGVASGRVLVDSTRKDISVTGNAANLASRLYDLAKQNDTLISDATYRAAVSVVDCEVYGELDIKGLPRKVRVHRLLKLKGHDREHRHPIFGREMEINQLRALLRTCAERRSGQMVYVRGDAGIGKTRLVEAYDEIAAQQGYQCHRVLIFDFGMAINQDPLRLLTRSLLGIDNFATRSQIDSIIDGLVRDRPDANIRRAHLNDLIGVEQPGPLRALLDAVDDAARAVAGRELICALVREAASESLVSIIIEDIHWAEQTVLNQITALAETVRSCASIIVVTSRIDGDPFLANSAAIPMITINLSALDSRAATNLAHNFIKNNEHIVNLCVERAGGNPLFLEQLLRSAGDAVEENLPGSVSSIVLSRMDKLSSEHRSGLQAASVIGQRFELLCLQHLIEDDHYNPDTLIRQALIRPDADGYLFAHALVHEGVYDSMLRDQRRGLHLRAAAWYQQRDLALWAEHLERGNADASEAYLVAAQHAFGQYRFDSAVKLVDSGLACAKDNEYKYRFYRLRGELCERLGEIAMCVDDLQNALAHAQSDAQRCQTHIQLAANLRVADKLDDAIEHLDNAEQIAVPDALYAELSNIHFQRGNIFFPMGKIKECLTEHARARELAHALNNPSAEANALSGLGDANYQRGHMRTAFNHFQACLKIAEDHHLKRIDVANRHMRGLARYYLGELEPSLDDCLDGVNNAAEVGHQRAEMAARCSVGPILVDLNNLVAAKRESELGLELAEKLGAKRFEPLALITLGRVAAMDGDVSGGVAQIRMAVDIANQTGATFTGPWALGCLAATSTDASECDEALAQGEALLEEGALAHCHLWFHRYAIERGRATDNEALVNKHISALRAFTKRQALPWVAAVIDGAQAE